MKNKAGRKEIESMVLETAAGLISKHGFKGWNMEGLAHACGIAKNTLYKIVGSKEELVERIIMEQTEQTAEYFRAIILNSGGYREAARKLLEEAPRYISNRNWIMLSDVFVEYPSIRQKVIERHHQATEAIIGYIRMGQEGGHIRDDVEPEFLRDLVRGIIGHYVRSGLEGEALSRALTKAFTCLREGVRVGSW